jgi:hypothetical protein
MHHQATASLGAPLAMPLPSSINPAFQQSFVPQQQPNSPIVPAESGNVTKHRSWNPLTKSRPASLELEHTPEHRATLIIREKMSFSYDLSVLENGQRVSGPSRSIASIVIDSRQ